jgi:predicted ATP-binding protein involved in virulence
MLKRATFQNLRGYSEAELRLSLNPDLNLITGKNGAGKTTFLKVLWYLTSGNIHVAAEETPFSLATIETDDYTMTVDLTDRSNPKVDVDLPDDSREFRSKTTDELDFEDLVDDDEDGILEEAGNFTEDFGRSLFFPTFRRVEGGYTIPRDPPLLPRLINRSARMRNPLEEGLAQISRRLSNMGHDFVCSISTNDIVSLVLDKYNYATEQYSTAQQELSSEIIEEIRHYEQGEILDLSNADEVLKRIKSAIESVDSQRIELMSSLNAVQDLVMEIFDHRGISFGQRFSFGEKTEAILSEYLSAGEKQMLSFICYNAFYDNAVIFIDEPELSLHVDWQRQLFPTLECQGTTNQFIVATHSPFIYSKYPEKEILLGTDRGD